jgi:hypothetical protein
MTSAESAPAAPPRHRFLRIALAVVAALELVDALGGAQNIFTDYHHETAYLRFAQALTSIDLALAPVIAATALLYAAWGNLRRAILALAALALLTWLLDDIWSIPIHGLELEWSYGGQVALFHHFIFPAAAIAGGALALKQRRLALAGLLVSVPTLYNWIGVVLFTIAVMRHGF